MVANLTVGKRGYEGAWPEMKEAALRAQALKDDLLSAVDEDTRAFNKVMEGFGLPKATEDQVREKEAALERAYKEATLVPLGVLEKCVELLELAALVARKGNKNSVSDAGVAGLIAGAAAAGAFYNVKINLPGIRDGAFKEEVLGKGDEFMNEVSRLAEETRNLIEREFAGA
jgi:glutamate formiminotransferase/formiminotetrahydrofolate cyclodeaminase